LDKETNTIVLHVPSLVKNILPVRQFLDESYILVFIRKKCWILSKESLGKIVGNATHTKGSSLYILDVQKERNFTKFMCCNKCCGKKGD
jgi:hypothetical protein